MFFCQSELNHMVIDKELIVKSPDDSSASPCD